MIGGIGVKHINIETAGKAELRQKNLHKERGKSDQAAIDPKFAAHLDLGPTKGPGQASQSRANPGGIVRNVPLGINNSPRPRERRQSIAEQYDKLRHNRGTLQNTAMHRGEGFSTFMIGGGRAPVNDPETFTTLQGSIPAHQDSSKSAEWSKGAPQVGTAKNPLLEDEHLKMLLGDCNSELMFRIQKAAAALDRLWALLDTDGDGKINYMEVKNIFSKWSHTLASDAEKHLLDTEHSSESRISHERFIDIFLPLAMSVSPDLILDHLSSRFAEATASLQLRQSAHIVQGTGGRRGSASARKSMFSGVAPDAFVGGVAAARDSIGNKRMLAHRESAFVGGSVAAAARNSIGDNRKLAHRGSMIHQGGKTTDLAVASERNSILFSQTHKRSSIEDIKEKFMTHGSIPEEPASGAPKRDGRRPSNAQQSAAMKDVIMRSFSSNKRSSIQ